MLYNLNSFHFPHMVLLNVICSPLILLTKQRYPLIPWLHNKVIINRHDPRARSSIDASSKMYLPLRHFEFRNHKKIFMNLLSAFVTSGFFCSSTVQSFEFFVFIVRVKKYYENDLIASSDLTRQWTCEWINDSSQSFRKLSYISLRPACLSYYLKELYKIYSFPKLLFETKRKA